MTTALRPAVSPPAAQTVVWQPAAGFQTKALSSGANETLIGGAKGSGKSDILIARHLRYVDRPKYKGLITRQSYVEMQELIRRGESDRLEFKSSARWNLHTKARDERIELVIAKAVIVPVTINTVKGIRNIAPGHFEVARIYRFSPLQTLTRLIVPSTLPSLATGLRLGLANAWMALVAVELLAASEGVGFLMVHSRQLFQLDMVMASMVVIGVTGWVLDRILQSVEQRLLAWRITAY